MQDGLTLAKRLGASVTHLTSYGPATAAEITALSECGRMSEMKLTLEEGSLSALVKAVCAMSGLCSLKLSWLSAWRSWSARDQFLTSIVRRKPADSTSAPLQGGD